MVNRLENELFESVKTLDDLGKDFTLEESLLIVSGADSREKLEKYKNRIGYLHKKYQNRLVKKDSCSKTRTLVKFVGNGKKRFRGREGDISNDYLTNVINRKIWRHKIGNCLGLSELAAVVGLREGLDLGCLLFPGHISLFLKNGAERINLETTIKSGFNFKYGNSKESKEEDSLLTEERIEVLLPVLLGDRGYLSYNLKDLDKAIDLFQDSDFYRWRGILFEENGKISEAIENYKKSIQIKPYHKSYFNLGSLLLEKNKLDEALENFNKCILKCPTHPLALIDRGVVHSKKGNYEKAVNDFIKAKNFGLKDHKINAHFNLGSVYKDMGEYKEALREFKKYSTYNEENEREVEKRIVYLTRKISLDN
ncbi:MAG: tetratricopeptide repeat protein [Nanoarchaeota archaeon]|nr:tetratricopeptide repeat protein [Nanoarchaeota archaeon]